MPSLPPIACKECGHVNEGERVYCHNCGIKLDRSILPTQKEGKEESPAQTQKRVKKLMNPDSGLGRDWWKTTIKALFFAALVAAGIDSALPPRQIPPMPKEKFIDAPELGQALEALTASPASRSMAFPQNAINAYLWNAARVKANGSWVQNVFKFQRAFVELEPGVMRITVQNSVQDHPLYAGVEYRLSVANNGLIATPAGGNIGRLQLPRELVAYLPTLLNYVNPPWDSLKQERTLMDKLQAVQVLKGQIILTSRGPAAVQASSKPVNTQSAGR